MASFWMIDTTLVYTCMVQALSLCGSGSEGLFQAVSGHARLPAGRWHQKVRLV